MEAAVAAICVEEGYIAGNRDAIDTLTQILKCYISELGQKSKKYCEVAQRSTPTVSDVHLALVELGPRIAKLEDYAHRSQRRHLPRQLRSYPHPQGKTLQVGTRKPHPSYVPTNLPCYPDNHTFLRTPTYNVPHVDHREVREKLASQNSLSRQSLSLLIGRVGPSTLVTGEVSDGGVFEVLLPNDHKEPSFVKGLMPYEAS